MNRRLLSVRSLGWLGLSLVLGLAGSARGRERILLDAGWRFHLGEVPAASQPDCDDRDWRLVNLPHDWSIEGTVDPHAPGTGRDGFFPTGIGWYRRSFVAPPAWSGQRVMIEFEGVYMNAEVWINGRSLGVHPYGYTPFAYDLTPYLQPGAANVLAVRVDNSQQPNSRWYSGSGIYRHVWLHVAGPVQVVPWGVFVATTEASDAAAQIRIETTVRNETDAPASLSVETRILDPAGGTVATASAPVQVAGARHGHGDGGGDDRASATLVAGDASAVPRRHPGGGRRRPGRRGGDNLRRAHDRGLGRPRLRTQRPARSSSSAGASTTTTVRWAPPPSTGPRSAASSCSRPRASTRCARRTIRRRRRFSPPATASACS